MTLNVPCPTTTTSTSTTSTTVATYVVEFFAQVGDSTFETFDIKYQINSGSIQTLSIGFDTTFCISLDTIIVNSGDSVTYFATYLGSSVYIAGSNSTVCPANSQSICSYTVSNITSNQNIAMTIYIDFNGNSASCI